MWHKISIKKEQAPLTTSPNNSKHYQRVVPLNQQNIRLRGSSKQSRSNHSRGKSHTEIKRNRSPKQSSFAEGIQMVSSEQLTSNKRVDLRKSPPENKFRIEYEEALPTLRVTREEDMEYPKVSKTEQQDGNSNLSVISELREKINSLKNELSRERTKNREVVQGLELKLRKAMEINLLYSNKLSQLATKMIVAKTMINQQLARYHEETSLIFTKVIEEVYFRVSSHSLHSRIKDKNEYQQVSPIKQEVNEEGSTVMAEPEEKLIKIIDSIQKLKQFVSHSKFKHKKEEQQPVVMEFIHELRNYDKKREKSQPKI